MVKIIGIGGVTNGGKTTLCEKLVKLYPGSNVINQDDFFRIEEDPKHVWITLKNGIKHQNWEAIESIDWQALDNKIVSIASEMSKGFLIIEGHLLFNYAFYSLPFDYKFFVTLDEKECSKRRAARVYIPPDPDGYFDECIWPMYIQNRKEMEKLYNDIVYLDGRSDQENTFNKVVEVIESQEFRNRSTDNSAQIQLDGNHKDIQAPNESKSRLEDGTKTQSL